MTKEQAIKLAGNQNKLAQILGISRMAVCQWKVIPQARIWQLQLLHPEWFINCWLICFFSYNEFVAVESNRWKPFTHAFALGSYLWVSTEGSCKRLFLLSTASVLHTIAEHLNGWPGRKHKDNESPHWILPKLFYEVLGKSKGTWWDKPLYKWIVTFRGS